MSSAAGLWWVIGIVGVVTYAFRSLFLLGPDRAEGEGEAPGFGRLLRHVPTAALAALVVSSVLSPTAGGVGVAPRLLALILAGLVAWRTRNILLTLAVGMAALWLVQALL